MRSLVKVWLIFPAILLGCVYAKSVIAHERLQTISTEKLAAKVEQEDDFYLINVLPKIIYDDRHIQGSINIPIGEILTSSLLPKVKSKQLIFYCMGTL